MNGLDENTFGKGDLTIGDPGSVPVERMAGPAADRFFGLMRIGGALLALPVPSIREVIPGQAAYCALPIKAEGLLGAVDIRGTIIPVLDLRHALGLGGDSEGEHVIVIMRWQGFLVGLRSAEVCGIAQLRHEDLFALLTNGTKTEGALATHTFQSGREIATLLDARSIANLTNIPLVAEKIGGTKTPTGTSIESILLFNYGLSHFGIDAASVDATVPAMRIERNALATGYCLGIIDHHGFEVPVVDTTAAIGLGPGKPALETAVIVVRFSDDAMLGFAIDAVRDIVRTARDDILALPSLVLGDAPLFRGMLSIAGGRQCLLIDSTNLRAHPALQALARLRKPRIALQGADTNAANEAGRAAATVARTRPFLTYVAGAEHATPLDQITEILTYPADIAPFECLVPGMLGLFTHRGRVAPLVCLGTLLGRACTLDPATARILFVEDGGRTVGFVVEALRSIEKASWHSPASDSPSSDRGLFNVLVMLGVGDQRRMVSHIDLVARIRRLYPEASPVERSDEAALPLAASA